MDAYGLAFPKTAAPILSSRDRGHLYSAREPADNTAQPDLLCATIPAKPPLVHSHRALTHPVGTSQGTGIWAKHQLVRYGRSSSSSNSSTGAARAPGARGQGRVRGSRALQSWHRATVVSLRVSAACLDALMAIANASTNATATADDDDAKALCTARMNSEASIKEHP